MSQSTPTPDTTARTETAETVTVPVEPTQEAIQAGLEAYLTPDVRDTSIQGTCRRVYTAMVAADALASPQHPVGVREARAKLIARLQGWRSWMGHADTMKITGEDMDDILAAISHPPAQDAPGAEALRDRLRSALEAELGDAVDCTRVWSAWGYGTMREDDFVPVADRLDEIVDGVLAALDLSPPLPEADGEVVAWAYEVQQHDDSWRADMSFSKPVAPYGGAIRNVEPLVRQSALVSALRERHTWKLAAMAEAEIGKRYEARAEKAEQVAAGRQGLLDKALAALDSYADPTSYHDETGALYEAGDTDHPGVLARDTANEIHAALRASTEEGKTATPSGAEGEAAQGVEPVIRAPKFTEEMKEAVLAAGLPCYPKHLEAIYQTMVAAATPSVKDEEASPASMTDEELSVELSKCVDQFKLRSEHGGSPFEYWAERAMEIETEQRRRASVPKP